MRRLLCLAACLAATVLAADRPSGVAKPISRASACKIRFEAFCAVMHRCSTGAEDLGGPGCEAIDPGCDGLQGNAGYRREAVEACISGLSKLSCAVRVDPSQVAQLEEGVGACAALIAADEMQTGR